MTKSLSARRIQWGPLILLALLSLTLIYPLVHVVGQAFFVHGTPSLQYFVLMASSQFYRDIFCNSLNLALAVTILCTAIAYPLAIALSRYALPYRALFHTLLLLPLVSPPFVGVLGVRHLFSRLGPVNAFLIEQKLIHDPIDWLGTGGVYGIIALQVVHLVPILYMSLSASLRNAHVSLEEAATMCGATRFQTLRRITLPLTIPAWFAGASLIFIASFTDLGTPLLFEYRRVVPVQIFNMLSDLNENPVGYSFVSLTCILSVSLFFLSRSALAEGSFAGTTRTKQGEVLRATSHWVRATVLILTSGYIALASLPNLAVICIAFSEQWFFSPLPQGWTLKNLIGVATHPMTLNSLIISTWLSLVASMVTLILGFTLSYWIVRRKGRWGGLFELLSIIPLAVPGIVFAFGYIGGFSGTPLDNRINPFPLLIIAYSIRRLPAMARSATAGLQEASVALEEAALVLGASPFTIARRVIMPLISRHLIVGAVLTFAYSMIEVSDSILLALEVKFYPISKAMYALMGRPDGVELASALGVIVMAIMLCSFLAVELLSSRSFRSRRATTALAILLTFTASTIAHAQSDELIGVTPHWEGIKEEFSQGFARHYKITTGRSVSIRWLDVGGTSDIIKYLKTQSKISPSGIGIDLLFGGGTDSLLELSRSGVLEPVELDPTILSAIPQTLAGMPIYSPTGEWFSTAFSTFGIVFNKVGATHYNLPLPRGWGDLASERYFDTLVIGDPRKSGSMHAMFEVILQGYGWDRGWEVLMNLSRNARILTSTAGQVGKEVASGEALVGIAIDTNAGDVIRRVGAERIGFVAPQDFASINGDGIAVIKGAPHRALAKAFIEYQLSEEGQRLWYLKVGTPNGPKRFEIGKLPVRPSVYGSGEPATLIEGNPYEWRNILPYDSAKAASRWNILNDLLGIFLVDNHDALVATKSHEGARLTAPVPESEVARLSPNGDWGSDQLLRNTMVQQWGTMATARAPQEAQVARAVRAVPGLLLLMTVTALVMRRIVKRLRRAG